MAAAAAAAAAVSGVAEALGRIGDGGGGAKSSVDRSNLWQQIVKVQPGEGGGAERGVEGVKSRIDRWALGEEGSYISLAALVGEGGPPVFLHASRKA